MKLFYFRIQINKQLSSSFFYLLIYLFLKYGNKIWISSPFEKSKKMVERDKQILPLNLKQKARKKELTDKFPNYLDFFSKRLKAWSTK